MTRVFFIHGLNTYGDDDLHIGPWRWAPMHSQWQDAFSRENIVFAAIQRIGTGSPWVQAERAIEQIQFALRDTPTAPIHLIGHSTGGLVACALATHPQIQKHVASVITIGTPHKGAIAAEEGIGFQDRFPLLHQLFGTFGYRTEEKKEIFQHFTPTAMASFHEQLAEKLREREGPLPIYSMICEVEKAQLSWPLLAMQRWFNPANELGDGLISSVSQSFGDERGLFALDHLGQLGFFPKVRSRHRHEDRLEFLRLTKAVCELVNTN